MSDPTEKDAPTPESGHLCMSGDASGPHRCSCGGWFDVCYQQEDSQTGVIPPAKP